MISRKSMKIIILASFCVLGIITAIPGFMMEAQKTNISSVKSALLNPKYVDSVNEVSLSFPDGCTLTFSKGVNREGNEIWSAKTDDGTSFTANSTMISQLIGHASETCSMAEISDSFTAWASLGLADDNAVNIAFSNNSVDGSRTTFSSLFFGYENADATMIYVRNDRKSTSWRIQDNYSSYLTDSLSFWADQRILPIGSLSETDDTRTMIKIETADAIKTLKNDVSNGESFDETVHLLLSLRSSGLLSLSEMEQMAPQAHPVMTVTLSDDSGNANSVSYGFTIYEAEYEDGVEYFARNSGILSTGDASYVLQISSWTFSRILEAFSD